MAGHEVEEHDGIAIGHGADRIAFVVDDDEPVEVLVAVVGLAYIVSTALRADAGGRPSPWVCFP